MQTDVLAKIDDPSLRAYVVWVPVLPDDGRPDEGNLALVPDRRATHFWDQHGSLPPLLRAILWLPSDWPAWDVYLAYHSGAKWEQGPPAPAFWHHQLGDEPAAPKLDGLLFASQLRELIAAE